MLLLHKENGLKHTPGAVRGCEICIKSASRCVEMHMSNLILIKKTYPQGNSINGAWRSGTSVVRGINERVKHGILRLKSSELEVPV